MIDGAPGYAYRMLDCGFLCQGAVKGEGRLVLVKRWLGSSFEWVSYWAVLVGIGKSAHRVKWRLSGRLRRRFPRGQHVAIEEVGRLIG